MAAVTKGVCAPEPWRPTRLPAWAQPLHWRRQAFDEEKTTIVRLRERLLEQLLSIPGVRLNGSPTQRIPHTLSLTFNEGEFNPRR